MSTYAKTMLRMLKNHFGRFVVILSIVALGIGLMSGLGAVEPKLSGSLKAYFDERQVADIIVKATSPYGFNQNEIEYFDGLDGLEALAFSSYDAQINELQTRLYFLPLSDMKINKLTLLEGKMPQNADEAAVERKTNALKEFKVGDIIQISGREVKVSGIVQNPLLIGLDDEPSTEDGKDLESVIYFNSKYAVFPIKTDVYLTVQAAKGNDYFSDAYKNTVKECIDNIKTDLSGGEEYVFLTLEENYGAAYFGEYAEKVKNISFIFSVFFVAVAALVVFTTMTRLVEEERSAIACYKTLGYNNARISVKYVFFSAVSSIIGSVLGFFILGNIVTAMIYNAFGFAFAMPVMIRQMSYLYGIISAAAMFLTAVIATVSILAKLLKEKSANLLKPKAPKAGKKILLERVGFIWKRLSFKYKSTMRNLFRYLSHFFMTVISVAGSTAIVVAGFGLYDSSSSMEQSSESMSIISLVLIVCAALLSILVIYNLTNINISERQREIATLKVLGYKNFEVAGYIYREIFILTLLGTLFGLPLGALFVNFVFGYVNFGSLSDMHWYSWLYVAGLSVLFTVVVDILLYRKITRTDMNASLKTVE